MARPKNWTSREVEKLEAAMALDPPVVTWVLDQRRRVMVAASVHDPHMDTGSGANSSKTHCKNKHPFDEVNTLFKTDGSRQCRTCKAEWAKQRRAA